MHATLYITTVHSWSNPELLSFDIGSLRQDVVYYYRVNTIKLYRIYLAKYSNMNEKKNDKRRNYLNEPWLETGINYDIISEREKIPELSPQNPTFLATLYHTHHSNNYIISEVRIVFLMEDYKNPILSNYVHMRACLTRNIRSSVDH